MIVSLKATQFDKPQSIYAKLAEKIANDGKKAEDSNRYNRRIIMLTPNPIAL